MLLAFVVWTGARASLPRSLLQKPFPLTPEPLHAFVPLPSDRHPRNRRRLSRRGGKRASAAAAGFHLRNADGADRPGAVRLHPDRWRAVDGRQRARGGVFARGAAAAAAAAGHAGAELRAAQRRLRQRVRHAAGLTAAGHRLAPGHARLCAGGGGAGGVAHRHQPAGVAVVAGAAAALIARRHGMARLNYIELPAADIAASKAFYAKAFGWTLADFGPSYAATTTGDVDVGLHGHLAEVLLAPLPVIQVDDLEAALA